jgi:hypothetical protein
LIEVDLKRPGRIDVKIPLFPTTSTQGRLSADSRLCKRRGLLIDESAFAEVEKDIPNLLTPGAAEALAIKVYRLSRVENLTPTEALKRCLDDYLNPVPPEVWPPRFNLPSVKQATLTSCRQFCAPQRKTVVYDVT